MEVNLIEWSEDIVHLYAKLLDHICGPNKQTKKY